MCAWQVGFLANFSLTFHLCKHVSKNLQSSEVKEAGTNNVLTSHHPSITSTTLQIVVHVWSSSVLEVSKTSVVHEHVACFLSMLTWINQSICSLMKKASHFHTKKGQWIQLQKIWNYILGQNTSMWMMNTWNHKKEQMNVYKFILISVSTCFVLLE